MARSVAASARPANPPGFYREFLRRLMASRIPFMLGGTCAVNVHVGLDRPTKDLDVFCRAGDYPRLLRSAADWGYRTEVEDERWIAKVRSGPHYCDVIFGSANMIAPVTDQWFTESRPAKVLGVSVRLLPPTELIWSKSFIQDRYKFDGNDVAHVILVKRNEINWRKLRGYFEQQWEVLLMHLLRFRYIYPSERNAVPGWLLDELLGRLADQRRLPLSRKKSCRGRVFSRDDFCPDVEQWGFADLVGDDKYSGPGRDDSRPKGLSLRMKTRRARVLEAGPNGEARGERGRGRGKRA